jgi:hypothetical protein
VHGDWACCRGEGAPGEEKQQIHSDEADDLERAEMTVNRSDWLLFNKQSLTNAAETSSQARGLQHKDKKGSRTREINSAGQRLRLQAKKNK